MKSKFLGINSVFKVYGAGCVYGGLEWLLHWPTSRRFSSIGNAQASRCQGWWFDPRAGQFQHCYINIRKYLVST